MANGSTPSSGTGSPPSPSDYPPAPERLSIILSGYSDTLRFLWEEGLATLLVRRQAGRTVANIYTPFYSSPQAEADIFFTPTRSAVIITELKLGDGGSNDMGEPQSPL